MSDTTNPEIAILTRKKYEEMCAQLDEARKVIEHYSYSIIHVVHHGEITYEHEMFEPSRKAREYLEKYK